MGRRATTGDRVRRERVYHREALMDEADTRRRGPRRAERGASPVLRARLAVLALLFCVLADAGPLTPALVNA